MPRQQTEKLIVFPLMKDGTFASCVRFSGKFIFSKSMPKKNYITLALSLILCLWSLKLFIEHRRYFERLKEDKKCWKNKALTVKSTLKTFLNIEDNFIPFEVEDAPKGGIASVPKVYKIEERDYCATRPMLKAITFVHSSINRIEKRNFTRHTWAKFSKKLGVVFFVGDPKNKTEQEIIADESRLYHDVVQGHYTDHYQLLTYKGLNGLFWVTKNCKQVPWVVHADDDVLLDVQQLFIFLHNLEQQDKPPMEIFGLVFKRSVVQRDDKWKVDLDEFPCRTYPSYCAGPTWFTSMTVVHELLAAVPHVKYLWVDDVYVTGLLAAKAGVKRTDVNMVNNYFKESHLGKTIAWLNVLTNRTLNWQSILSYYANFQIL